MKTGGEMNMMSTTFGRNTAASNMIIEDHINKVLTKTSKDKKLFIEPKNSKLVPRLRHSPFGDFPKDKYTVQKRDVVRKTVIAKQLGKDPIQVLRQTKTAANDQGMSGMGVRGSPMLKKGGGMGGKPFSLNKPKQAPPPNKPKAGARKKRKIEMSEFRRYYDRRDFPIVVEHTGSGCRLKWINDVDLAELDYHHYLPIFFEGLREKQDPYRFLAI